MQRAGIASAYAPPRYLCTHRNPGGNFGLDAQEGPRMRAATLTAVAALAAGGGLSAAVLGGGASAQVPGDAPAATTVALRAGDAMVVEGAPIGCQVIRRGGRLVIDCRRLGRL